MKRLAIPIVLLTQLATGPRTVRAQDAPPAANNNTATNEPAAQIVQDESGFPIRQLQRAAVAPEIDGVLDDPAWQDAGVIDDMLQIEPVERGQPSEDTVIHLTYDDHFLYVAFRCYDREPDKIVATEMRRDASLFADDRISFVIDTFFDRRNAFFFEMNPLGARRDALIEDNNNFRSDWDGIWYGKASIDNEGWVAEFAIPFKTLSFNPDSTRWGFNASRFIRRRNEALRWATPSQDSRLTSIADAGILEGISDIKQGMGIDFKPYTVATIKRDHERNEDGLDLDAGFDLFYKLTPSLTLALTANTDFAETEVDERRVNLTRFPLFFPEKRDFFLQDAGIFNFGGIRRNPLPFHSRRIGIGPGGEEQPILAGIKLTGRVDDLNLGLLDVQMKKDDVLGDKNLFVGRASLNVLEESTVGAIFTAGDPRTTEDAYLAGLDFNFRNSNFNGDKTISANGWFMFSDTADGKDPVGQSAFGGRISYPNDHIRWSAGLTHIDEDFDAALGFVPRRGIREYFANWRHRWRPTNGVIRSIDSGVNFFMTTNLDDDIESRNLNLEVIELETEEGDQFTVRYDLEREVLDEPFEISDGVIIPVGDHRFDRYHFEVESSRGRPVNVGLRYSGGEFFTGTRDEYEVDFDWRASSNLNLGAEFEINDIDLDQGSFITRIIRGRVNVFFTPDVSWTTFAQFDNVSDSVGINSRVRWIVEPGNELFFVLNQAIDKNDDSFQVRSTDMTAKVGWTFRF